MNSVLLAGPVAADRVPKALELCSKTLVFDNERVSQKASP